MFSKFRRLAYYGRMFLDFLKTSRKLALYAESRFLYEANRRILTTNYQSEEIEQNDIIISFTTHRERIHYVHYVLDSLFFQTIRPQEVRLYLTQGEYQSLPKVLKKFGSWLKIIEVEDLGTFKKFIPALQDVSRHQTLISLDDDLIYPPDFVQKLVDLKARHQDSMITFMAYRDRKTGFFDRVTGCGILWNLDVFNTEANPDFFKKELFIDAVGLRNLDDAWTSFYCKALGVNIHAVHENYLRTYYHRFIPLPSEVLHAVSMAKSELNIRRGGRKAEKRIKKIIKELMEKSTR
ncbi:hypothetical protein [Helicobacter mustelae]|uniref:Glycosyltransferase n=1 Tax=Helicobacter mustelae (strain ATCC 43772 / CCUG 25715 / CIP 103759 / LMG 18044 / NCTC 12198 / R85-136P) TaxID=679897 RepID=D3UI68_HELM1|nr:hypothetical protein [Helicobacter mustelae]CBG40191.1 Putative hypothetical protein [Helicobacter mustelae 12198]SQH71694.1 zn-dependent alcohol dehydrogenase [Helicobacter mustelae]STP12819.1 zn-dependent alcohol dehydrogenase [Helicobacter mustelae]